jgi:hypothetical protein
MFAQNHHPAMKFIMPVRKTIDEKTVFNILGPLTNPAKVKKSLLGVFSKEFIPKMAEAMKINGAKNVMVVSSKEGMDEIGLSNVTYAVHLKDGELKELEIDNRYKIETSKIKEDYTIKFNELQKREEQLTAYINNEKKLLKEQKDYYISAIVDDSKMLVGSYVSDIHVGDFSSIEDIIQEDDISSVIVTKILEKKVLQSLGRNIELGRSLKTFQEAYYA